MNDLISLVIDEEDGVYTISIVCSNLEKDTGYIKATEFKKFVATSLWMEGPSGEHILPR